MKTPLRYAGGKTKAKKIITPYVNNYDIIVSPFLGGGSLEVEWATLGKKVFGYDIFDILINFWSNLLHNNSELVKSLNKITPDSETYKQIKEKLLSCGQTQNLLKNWNTDHYKRSEILDLDNTTLAAYYFFNHNTSYGPGFLGWPSSVYLNQDKWKKMIKNISNFECKNLSVGNKSFEDVFEIHPKDFFYLDPPYFLEKDSDNKMFTGIYPMRNIPVHHDSFDHVKLRDLLLKHEGDFVLSYNNCETIREMYSDFEQFFPTWSYSMGNGETRVGNNRKKNNQNVVKESHEILIVKR